MARVQLADVINQTVFMDLPAENKPELTAFAQSGVVVRDPLADAICGADGQDGVLPFWLDLDPDSEPNYSTDQDSLATPEKVSQSQQRTRKSYLNKGYSAMDLARELQMNTDAMRHIRNRLDDYWTRQWQRRVVATTKGLFNSNVAGLGTATAGDMVYDISQETTVGLSAANYFSREAFTAAVYTMGDHAERLSAILVHSTVMKRMVDNDDIDYIIDSAGKTRIPLYMGHRVIVDDSSPTIAGTTSGTRYVNVIFGAAAFAWGESTPTVPVEVDRVPAQGDGGGEETLWTRKTWLIHPAGHDNTADTQTGGNASAWSMDLGDLAVGANWERTHFRKNVPIAFLVTNG